jgi:hypothetical protein
MRPSSVNVARAEHCHSDDGKLGEPRRYRKNELTPDQRTEFDRHLTVCPSCVASLKTYEQTVLLEKAAAGDPVPDEIPNRW